MEIIFKYYDNKLVLRKITKNKLSDKKPCIIRFKIFGNNKEWPCCDFHGKCTNKAYAEVYPFLRENSENKDWSYLCKRHYTQAQKKLDWKLPACLSVEW